MPPLFRFSFVIKRGRMGIEPTRDSVSLPHNGFEDRTPHQQRSIPRWLRRSLDARFQIRARSFFECHCVNYRRQTAVKTAQCLRNFNELCLYRSVYGNNENEL